MARGRMNFGVATVVCALALLAASRLLAVDVSANMEDLLKIESPTLTAAGSMRTFAPSPFGGSKVTMRFAVRFAVIDTGGVPFVVDRNTFKASVSGMKSSAFTNKFTAIMDGGDVVGLEATVDLTPKSKVKAFTFKATVKSLLGSVSTLIPKMKTLKDTDTVRFLIDPQPLSPEATPPDVNTAPPSIDLFDVYMWDDKAKNQETEVRSPATNAVIGRPSYETEAVWFYMLYSDADWSLSEFSLDFGDGSEPYVKRELMPGTGMGIGGGQGTYHYYPEAGSYPVTFTVTDYHGATTTVSQTVYVQARMIEFRGGVQAFEPHPNYPNTGIPVFVDQGDFTVGDTVKFKGNFYEAGGGGSATIDFGDGSEAWVLPTVGGVNGFAPHFNGQTQESDYVGPYNPQHVYTAAGTYTVTLTSRIRDGYPASGGQVRTLTWQVTITE